jgi:hypothetical protein
MNGPWSSSFGFAPTQKEVFSSGEQRCFLFLFYGTSAYQPTLVLLFTPPFSLSKKADRETQKRDGMQNIKLVWAENF